MNIDKFKHQHEDILADITALRELVHSGTESNAERIAARIVGMSGNIKLHLAVEDKVLYPTLAGCGDTALARMSHLYQLEMNGIVAAYMAFATAWNSAARLLAAPEKFRAEANGVLRRVYERIKKEDHEFYPAAEALAAERLAA
ncbi:hemerythrin [Massilia sp. Root418]|uniref:hemerythrin domain-containing protein n=1 Tax=Massilia sp. Root418 TaxID=1736532 RepID=UPI0006F2229A|nr:hemerythrin domain-containing protein [Massilia sp. Root418]KQX01352.1 hemerythrin [Massilia sp. Root418]